ncbi:MAG: hypothetical protein ABI476_08615 [Oxalobacteraceae bacterium]
MLQLFPGFIAPATSKQQGQGNPAQNVPTQGAVDGAGKFNVLLPNSSALRQELDLSQFFAICNAFRTSAAANPDRIYNHYSHGTLY